MATINQKIIEQAWANWITFHYGIDCDEVCERFFEMLDKDDKYYISPWGLYSEEEPEVDLDAIEVSDELKAKLQMAAGPNFRVMFKAWYVKNPW